MKIWTRRIAQNMNEKIWKIIVHILGNAMTSYFHFEIYWPLGHITSVQKQWSMIKCRSLIFFSARDISRAAPINKRATYASFITFFYVWISDRYITTNNIHTLGMSRLPRNFSWMVWIVVTKNVVLLTLFTHQRRYIFSILWRWLGPFIDGYFFHRSHEWSVESDILMDMVGGPIPTPIQCTVFG